MALLSSPPRRLPLTTGPSPTRFASTTNKTVITIDSSSPRLPSPSSFLKRTATSRPVFRRSSTRSQDHGPQVDLAEKAAEVSIQDLNRCPDEQSTQQKRKRTANLPLSPRKRRSLDAEAIPLPTLPSPSAQQGVSQEVSSSPPLPETVSISNTSGSTEPVIGADHAVDTIESQPSTAKAPRKTAKNTTATAAAGTAAVVGAGGSVNMAKPARKKPCASKTTPKKRRTKKGCPLAALRASASVSPGASRKQQEDQQQDQQGQMHDPQPNEVQDLAPSRRKDWTPVRDGHTSNAEDEEGAHVRDDTTITSPSKFTSMLGQFNHKAPEASTAVASRSPSSGAKTSIAKTTKRPLAAVEGVPATRRRATKAANAKPKAKASTAKTAKEPAKRKPRKSVDRLKNVTDHALAPYRPQQQPATQTSSTIQAMLTRGDAEDDDEDEERECSQDEDGFDTIKETRKPVQSNTGVVALLHSMAPGTPSAKCLKENSRFKINVPPPAEALSLLHGQDFIFGTSSQLAKDESPGTLRQIQQAIQDSEETAAAFVSQSSLAGGYHSPSNSKGVVEAPHGTSLSIGPSKGRKLWAVAARDVDERTLAAELRIPSGLLGPTSSVVRSGQGEKTLANAPPIVLSSSPAFEDWNAASKEPAADDKHDSAFCDINELDDVAGVDIADASVAPVDLGIVTDEVDPARQILQTLDSNATLAPVQEDLHETAAAALDGIMGAKPVQPIQPIKSLKARKRTTKSATSKHTAAEPIGAGEKKPRGRPRKVHTDGNAAAAVSGEVTEIPIETDRPEEQPPAKKPRGRPRKDLNVDKNAKAPVSTTEEGVTTGKPKAPRAATKKRKVVNSTVAVRPLTGTTMNHAAKEIESSGRFQDIDEILDSEDERLAIPPLRLSSSSPKAVSPNPLDLVVPHVQNGATSPTKTLSSNKPKTHASQADLALGTAYYTNIFAQIAATIKSAPRTTDPKRPSWLEKIMLYDPIVLEDLTTWLNEQGLRVSYERVKKSGSGRTKKKQTENALADVDAEVAEMEMIIKELEPWMVQKWCESQSVCCLWREGLRGGVRYRY